MFKKTNFLFAYLLICLLFWASVGSANAQTNLPKGITVIPSIIYLDLTTDPAQYDIKYVNYTNVDIKLELSSQDFSELDDAYRINFLEPKDAKNYKYSLSSWISFENPNLEIAAGKEKSVKVFIDAERLTQGGHYASVLAKVNQINSEEKININPVISSLVFVRSPSGNEVERGKISEFKQNRSFLDFPENFTLKFQNSGNVHVEPYGLLEITDFRGKVVATGILNEGSLTSLPESIRTYNIKLDSNSKILFPGIYKAKVTVNFGKSEQKLEANTRFFSQGSLNLLKISIFLVIILGILFILRKKTKKNKKPDLTG